MIPFSVLLCTYAGDSPDFLKLAINSVVTQSKPASELVVVVDGPVGGELRKVLEEFDLSIPYMRVVWLEKNLGHGDARRIGLENCRNEIVALMDADDVSLPQRFEKQLDRIASDQNLSVVGGALEEFRLEDGVEHLCGVRRLPESDEEIKSLLKWRCPINQPTVMFRRSAVDAAGGYIDWYCNEDYYLWSRMILDGAKFANLQDVVLRFRVDRDTYVRRGGMKYFLSEAKLQIYLFRNGLSNLPLALWNILIRFGAQVVCPPRLRGFLYRKLYRSESNGRAST